MVMQNVCKPVDRSDREEQIVLSRGIRSIMNTRGEMDTPLIYENMHTSSKVQTLYEICIAFEMIGILHKLSFEILL